MNNKRYPPDPELEKKWEEYSKKMQEEEEQKKKKAAEKVEVNKEEPKEVKEQKVEDKTSENLSQKAEIPSNQKKEEKEIEKNQNEMKDVKIPQKEEKHPIIEEKKVEVKEEIKKEVNFMKVKEKKDEKPFTKAIEVDEKMKRISTFNGDVLDNYWWGQTVNDVTFQLELPQGTLPKNLEVKITPTAFFAKVKGSKVSLLEGEFFERVKAEESFWTVEDKKYLTVTIQKQKDVIWATVLKGDREINIMKVDNAHALDQFDYETQAQLNKVLYEDNRYKRGLPTTDEQRKMELFKKLARTPDTPFYEGNRPYVPSFPEKEKDKDKKN